MSGYLEKGIQTPMARGSQEVEQLGWSDEWLAAANPTEPLLHRTGWGRGWVVKFFLGFWCQGPPRNGMGGPLLPLPPMGAMLHAFKKCVPTSRVRPSR